MDEKPNDAPFRREPWQKLLADDADGPPETTDARIRARARRDLTPRGHRWWLPASLAASFVLAVFIVQSEFGAYRAPARVVTDLPGGAMDARFVEREPAKKESSEPGRSASAPAPRSAEAPVEPELEPFGADDAEFAADAAGAGPRIGGPEHELKAATEVPEEALADAPTDLGRAREPRLESPAAMAVPVRTPEAWYAEIERLRAEGKREEAERELERLEKAHPGWVARYLEERKGAR